jgi:hypothetical protein
MKTMPTLKSVTEWILISLCAILGLVIFAGAFGLTAFGVDVACRVFWTPDPDDSIYAIFQFVLSGFIFAAIVYGAGALVTTVSPTSRKRARARARVNSYRY